MLDAEPRRLLVLDVRGSFHNREALVGPARKGPAGASWKLEVSQRNFDNGRWHVQLVREHVTPPVDFRKLRGEVYFILPTAPSIAVVQTHADKLLATWKRQRRDGSQNLVQLHESNTTDSGQSNDALSAFIICKEFHSTNKKFPLAEFSIDPNAAGICAVGGTGQGDVYILAYVVFTEAVADSSSIISLVPSAAARSKSFPSPTNSRQQLGLVGLTNQGATCYLNGLLQALFHLPVLRALVYHTPIAVEPVEAAASAAIDLDGPGDESAVSPPTFTVPRCLPSPTAQEVQGLISGSTRISKHSAAVAALQEVFFRMEAGAGPALCMSTAESKAGVSTEPLTDAFGWNRSQVHQQQDVSEMFIQLLDQVLEPQMQYGCTGLDRSLQQLFHVRTVRQTRVLPGEALPAGEVRQPVLDPALTYISAPVDPQNGQDRYTDLFSSLRDGVFARESVPDLETVDGSGQKVKLPGESKTYLANAPPVLAVSINRFVWSGVTGDRVKDNGHFAFPEVLDVSTLLPTTPSLISTVQQMARQQQQGQRLEQHSKPAALQAVMSSCQQLASSGALEALLPQGAHPATSTTAASTGSTSSSASPVQANKTLYRLKAVLVHRGEAKHGHYYAYIRPALGKDSAVLPGTKGQGLARTGAAGMDGAAGHAKKEGVQPASHKRKRVDDPPVVWDDALVHGAGELHDTETETFAQPLSAAERAYVRRNVTWQPFEPEEALDEPYKQLVDSFRASVRGHVPCEKVVATGAWTAPGDVPVLADDSDLWSEADVQAHLALDEDMSGGTGGSDPKPAASLASSGAASHSLDQQSVGYEVRDWLEADRQAHNGWFCMNDDTVTPVRACDAVEGTWGGLSYGGNAYFLMYIREDALPVMASGLGTAVGPAEGSSEAMRGCRRLSPDGLIVSDAHEPPEHSTLSGLLDSALASIAAGQAVSMDTSNSTAGAGEGGAGVVVEDDDVVEMPVPAKKASSSSAAGGSGSAELSEADAILASIAVGVAIPAPTDLYLRVAAQQRHKAQTERLAEEQRQLEHSSKRVMLYCVTDLHVAAHPLPAGSAPHRRPAIFTTGSPLQVSWDTVQPKGAIPVPGPALSEPVGKLYSTVGDALGLPQGSFRLRWCVLEEGRSVRQNYIVPFHATDAWAPPYRCPTAAEKDETFDSTSPAQRKLWSSFNGFFAQMFEPDAVPHALLDQGHGFKNVNADTQLLAYFPRALCDAANDGGLPAESYSLPMILASSTGSSRGGTLDQYSSAGGDRAKALKALTPQQAAAMELLEASVPQPWLQPVSWHGKQQEVQGVPGSPGGAGDAAGSSTCAVVQDPAGALRDAPWPSLHQGEPKYSLEKTKWVLAMLYVELLPVPPLYKRLTCAASLRAKGASGENGQEDTAEAMLLHPALRRLAHLGQRTLDNQLQTALSLLSFCAHSDPLYTLRLPYLQPLVADVYARLSRGRAGQGTGISSHTDSTDGAVLSSLCAVVTHMAAIPCRVLTAKGTRLSYKRMAFVNVPLYRVLGPEDTAAGCIQTLPEHVYNTAAVPHAPIGPLSFLSNLLIPCLATLPEALTVVGTTLGLLPVRGTQGWDDMTRVVDELGYQPKGKSSSRDENLQHLLRCRVVVIQSCTPRSQAEAQGADWLWQIWCSGTEKHRSNDLMSKAPAHAAVREASASRLYPAAVQEEYCHRDEQDACGDLCEGNALYVAYQDKYVGWWEDTVVAREFLGIPPTASTSSSGAAVDMTGDSTDVPVPVGLGDLLAGVGDVGSHPPPMALSAPKQGAANGILKLLRSLQSGSLAEVVVSLHNAPVLYTAAAHKAEGSGGPGASSVSLYAREDPWHVRSPLETAASIEPWAWKVCLQQLGSKSKAVLRRVRHGQEEAQGGGLAEGSTTGSVLPKYVVDLCTAMKEAGRHILTDLLQEQLASGSARSLVGTGREGTVLKKSDLSVPTLIRSAIQSTLTQALLVQSLVGGQAEDGSEVDRSWPLPPVLLPVMVYVDTSAHASHLVQAVAAETNRRLHHVLCAMTIRLLELLHVQDGSRSTLAASALAVCSQTPSVLLHKVASRAGDILQAGMLQLHSGDKQLDIHLDGSMEGDKDLSEVLKGTHVSTCPPLLTCPVHNGGLLQENDHGAPVAGQPFRLTMSVGSTGPKDWDVSLETLVKWCSLIDNKPVTLQVHWTGFDPLSYPVDEQGRKAVLEGGAAVPSTFLLACARQDTYGSVLDRIATAVGLPSASGGGGTGGVGVPTRATLYRAMYPHQGAGQPLVPQKKEASSMMMAKFLKQAPVPTTRPSSGPLLASCPLLAQPLTVLSPTDTIQAISSIVAACMNHHPGEETSIYRAIPVCVPDDMRASCIGGGSRNKGTDPVFEAGKAGVPSLETTYSQMVVVVEPVPSWEPSFPNSTASPVSLNPSAHTGVRGAVRAVMQVQEADSMVIDAVDGVAEDSASAVQQYRWLAVSPSLVSSTSPMPPGGALPPCGRTVLVPVQAVDTLSDVLQYARVRLGCPAVEDAGSAVELSASMQDGFPGLWTSSDISRSDHRPAHQTNTAAEAQGTQGQKHQQHKSTASSSSVVEVDMTGEEEIALATRRTCTASPTAIDVDGFEGQPQPHVHVPSFLAADTDEDLVVPRNKAVNAVRLLNQSSAEKLESAGVLAPSSHTINGKGASRGAEVEIVKPRQQVQGKGKILSCGWPQSLPDVPYPVLHLCSDLSAPSAWGDTTVGLGKSSSPWYCVRMPYLAVPVLLPPPSAAGDAQTGVVSICDATLGPRASVTGGYLTLHAVHAYLYEPPENMIGIRLVPVRQTIHHLWHSMQANAAKLRKEQEEKDAAEAEVIESGTTTAAWASSSSATAAKAASTSTSKKEVGISFFNRK